jgi:membrane protein YqaA with SNARE-associated domain
LVPLVLTSARRDTALTGPAPDGDDRRDTISVTSSTLPLIDALLAVEPPIPLLVSHERMRLLERLVESATGWPGLGIIFVYSILVTLILPAPSEIVLATPLDIGLPYGVELAIIVVVSSVGKAAGSVLAFKIGHGVRHSGPVVSWLRRSRFEVIQWSEKRTVEVVQRWGYVGLALALCVPFFPDTISVYAFAVVEEDDVKFALATFAGSVGRFLIVIGVIGGSLTLL